MPMLGFSLEQPFSKRISVFGLVLGGYLPKVDSLRNEGGTVRLKQSHADVLTGLLYHVVPNLDLQAGFAFHYFAQRETSHEDGNDFELWNTDLTLGLAYRF